MPSGMSEPADQQHVVIVSGLSGAGKSTALKALEDMGYHCIDNLPVPLLDSFAQLLNSESGRYQDVALGMDARAPAERLAQIPNFIGQLREAGVKCQLLYLDASDSELIRRFGKTRRSHPLAQGTGPLQSAIKAERATLKPLRQCADWTLDTSDTNVHQLAHETWKCIGPDTAGMTVVMQSFGFSHGIPDDIDFLFDLRSLPNPHWNEALRPLSGRDQAVAQWLQEEPSVDEMATDMSAFLQRWLPQLQSTHRSFVTIGLGCTGGQHRSVYMAERLAAELAETFPGMMIHHRELGP